MKERKVSVDEDLGNGALKSQSLRSNATGRGRPKSISVTKRKKRIYQPIMGEYFSKHYIDLRSYFDSTEKIVR